MGLLDVEQAADLHDPTSRRLWVVGGTYLVVLAAMVAGVLWHNGGHFAYTLDDPYIHLELARNLASGHYGINPGEPSAPASSLLWPWLLVPWWWASGATYAPLAYNALASLLTIGAMMRVLRLVLPTREHDALAIFLGITGVLAANLWALTLTGLEHNLQLALAAWFCVGLIEVDRGERPPPWLWLVGALMPLVRYEMLGLMLFGGLFLAQRGHRRVALWACGTGLALLLAKSAWLWALTDHVLPFSIQSKSVMAHRGMGDLLARDRLGHPVVGLPLALCLLGFWLTRHKRARDLEIGLIPASIVLAHVSIAVVGLFHRSISYVYVVVPLLVLWSARDTVRQAFVQGGSPLRCVAWVALILATVHTRHTVEAVPAAGHVYRLHHTLHRLSTEAIEGPIAVNDIGWAALGNDHYVMDLVGLASKEALEHLIARDDPAWMTPVIEAHGIQLIAVFSTWFDELPPTWVRLGTLVVDRSPFSAQLRHVDLFAPDEAAAARLRHRLGAFAPSLPEGTRLVVAGATISGL